MNKWKKILMLALCLVMVQVPLFLTNGSAAVRAEGKTGLQKEGGKYYFYSQDGNPVRNAWQTVTAAVGGMTVGYRYYFKNNGVACMGKVVDGVMKPAVKAIGGQYYGFDQFGRMLKGVYVKDGVFYVFSSDTGAMDTAATSELRAAALAGSKFSALTKLLKTMGVAVQKKQTDLPSSSGDGTDMIYSYAGFDVQGFKDRNTKAKTVVSIAATATPVTGVDPATGQTPESEDPADTSSDPSAQNSAGLRNIDGKYYYYNKKGVAVKNKWKTVSGKRYYFTADGSAQTESAKINGTLYLFDLKGRLANGKKNRFKNVGGKRYFVNKDGQPYVGWLVIDRDLYFANKKGVLKVNKTSSGITFDSKGKAASSVAANLKITTIQIMSRITTSEMTKEQKLQACWDYVVDNGDDSRHFSFNNMRVPDFTKKGWQKQEALDMFNSRAGGSYGFACAFAALASQAGYKATVVAGRVSSKETSTDDGGDGMVPHCWVIIDDKYYDPEAHYRGWWKDVYGYTTYSIAHTDQYTAKM